MWSTLDVSFILLQRISMLVLDLTSDRAGQGVGLLQVLSALEPSQQAVGPLGLLWGLRFGGGTGAATFFTVRGARLCNLHEGTVFVTWQEGVPWKTCKSHVRERVWVEDNYAFSVSSMLLRQLGLPQAATLIPVLLLLPEALLLLQGQRDPQGPRLLILDPGTVQ